MADIKKRVYTLLAEVKNVEIRKVEDTSYEFNEKEYHRIDLQCDDEDGERIYFTDKNMENLPRYKRGLIGTFKIRIDCETEFGTKAKITVVDFIPNENT